MFPNIAFLFVSIFLANIYVSVFHILIYPSGITSQHGRHHYMVDIMLAASQHGRIFANPDLEAQQAQTDFL